MKSSSTRTPKHNDTVFVHAGTEPDPTTGAIMTPIYQTSTFVQQAPGNHKGYEYARSQNPTRKALENALAQIEMGTYGLAFGSGVAATDAVLRLLQPGDHVIAANDMYGGTYRLFSKIYANWGIDFSYIDTTNTANVAAAITPLTKLVWLETPTNPLMRISDIESIAQICKQHQLLLCVDNTFATPYLQNPLQLGADLVMHSATKYIGGHSDLIQGALVMNSTELYEKLYFIQKSCGAVPGPMDCFLALRGIKTLPLRMRQHCANGKQLATFLRQHPKVQQVFWCGFEDAQGYQTAKKQMKNFGGMMSFTLKENSTEAIIKVLSGTKIFALAESLGGVESLINHPATMTHASIPEVERNKIGVTNNLIRLSVGVEDVDDLQADLEQALNLV